MNDEIVAIPADVWSDVFARLTTIEARTTVRGRDGQDGRDSTTVGPRGKPGRDGRDGRDGAEGKNTFEVVRSAGLFTGTIVEWCATLKGERGDRGPAGDRGIAGAKGDPGPRGDIGPQGPMPLHEWSGTRLRFEIAPDTWGDWVDLRGPAGTDGAASFVGGGTLRAFTARAAGFVPPSGIADGTKFLRDDGVWATAANSYFPGGW